MNKSNTAHESGHLHVSGEAVYIDDIMVNEQTLAGYVYYSPKAHARIRSYDLKKAKEYPGVSAVVSCKDVPAENDMGPVVHDEPILADGTVEFVGQAIFLIAARDEDIAREAAELIEIEYEELPAILSIEQAIERGELIAPARKIERGDTDTRLMSSPRTIEGKLSIGAQEHWYLETQTALAVPGEDRDIKVYSSTQHPSETQLLIAKALGITEKEVEVEVRRMGGAFGGKETQANHTALWASLLAVATGRPIKIRLFRDDDQKMTGKRHRYLTHYKAGFNDDGNLLALELELNADAGYCTDLSMAVLERAMMHSDNSYYISDIRITGKAWKTNLPSNTAFRGFGGPQGVAAIENIMDRIARELKIDAAEIRYRNFYQNADCNSTPYEQIVENNRLSGIWDQIINSSEYQQRRRAIEEFNEAHEFLKKGMALTPIKFGISFTTSFLNQAGALVHVYKDGSILVNHGGTEMGQGLHTKIKNIAAAEFGVDDSVVKVNATNTAKVPNTSATAASAGTDLNGFAVKNAVDKIKARLSAFLIELWGIESLESNATEHVVFESGRVSLKASPDKFMPFEEAILQAYLNQVSLSATGFYKTPDIHFDRDKGKGKPYHYFAFGMAVTEVTLDTLTGHHQMERVDIVHDVGESVNPRIDIGQIEGGFIQGVGWCTTEECKWDDQGNLLNHSPDTYKIPNVQDVPNDFRVKLLENAPNDNTIRRSKAVGEPPLMLCFSCWLAIKDAISAVAGHTVEPEFSLPATNEVILLSIDSIRKKLSEKVVI